MAMDRKYLWAIIFIIVSVLIFFVTPITFPPPPAMASQVAPDLLPHFLAIGLWGSVGIGVGISFLIIYGGLMRTFPHSARAPVMIFLAGGLWYTLLTWVHDGWHAINGDNIRGLVPIEYTFHMTDVIWGILLLYGVLRLARLKIVQ